MTKKRKLFLLILLNLLLVSCLITLIICICRLPSQIELLDSFLEQDNKYNIFTYSISQAKNNVFLFSAVILQQIFFIAIIIFVDLCLLPISKIKQFILSKKSAIKQKQTQKQKQKLQKN